MLPFALAHPRAEASQNTSAPVGPLHASGPEAGDGPPGESVALPSTGARFLSEPASDEARRVADWVMGAGDNQRQPFAIIDKQAAKIFVFDHHGLLLGAAPVLLGLARGDESVPGIGDRPLSAIRPEERTTPAGRFVAALGTDPSTGGVLWVDYQAALSLHRVITTSAKERRLERLATASPLDNKISFGCINVPSEFYDRHIATVFSRSSGIVYILPEVRKIEDVFPLNNLESRPQPSGGDEKTSPEHRK